MGWDGMGWDGWRGTKWSYGYGRSQWKHIERLLSYLESMQCNFEWSLFNLSFVDLLLGRIRSFRKSRSKMIRNIDWSVGNFVGEEIMKVRNEIKLVNEFHGVEWCDTVAAADLYVCLPKNCHRPGQLFLLHSTFFVEVSWGLRFSQIFCVDFWRVVPSSVQLMTLSVGEVQLSIAYQFC